MPNENRWSTRSFDLAKGAVLLVVLVLVAVVVIAGPKATSEQQPPAGAVAVSDTPQATAEASLSLSGMGEPKATVGQVPSESKAAVAPVGGTTPEAVVTVARIESHKVEPGGALSLSGSAEPGSTVELWAGEIKLAIVPVNALGNWLYEGQLDTGDYKVVARTVNAEGQVVNESKSVDVSVSAVSTATVTISEPQLDASGEVILSGTGEPGSTLEILDSGAVVTTATVGEDGKWTVRYTASSGEHALTAKIKGQADESGTAASATVVVPASAGGHSHVVQRGEWLMSLARRYYGDSLRWKDIYEATNAKAARDPSYHKLKDPSYLLPGWKLWIPEP